MSSSAFLKLAAAAALVFGAPAYAQVTPIDPNDAGEYEPGAYPSPDPEPVASDWENVPNQEYVPIGNNPAPAQPAPRQPAGTFPAADPEVRASRSVSNTVAKDNVLAAAEGVFGRGAEGLAGIIEDILSKQGEPNAYITGSEAGGAIVVGLRYGKGTLYHQTEGDRKVYWTGPSVGFDFGGDANKVFVLAYNLDGSEDLFKRFGAAEGNVYVVGGFKASYMRNGNTVLIPIRTGLGVRVGVNAGYMKFTPKGTWIPF